MALDLKARNKKQRETPGPCTTRHCTRQRVPNGVICYWHQRVNAWRRGGIDITYWPAYIIAQMWRRMLRDQNWVCAICKVRPATDWDHRHGGATRGILCRSCNIALGHLEGHEHAVVDYLTSSRGLQPSEHAGSRTSREPQPYRHADVLRVAPSGARARHRGTPKG